MTRDNVGRDFGAWRDALAVALERNDAMPRELLLANDSVLGPIRPLAPLVAELRGGWGRAIRPDREPRRRRGTCSPIFCWFAEMAAVAEMSRHLADCRLTRSKWRLVQVGEIGLTRRMLERGHRVAALFGYDRVTEGLSHAELLPFGPRFAEPGAVTRYPLNPTHHLWRILVERFGFPYLKTELVLRNVGRLSGVDAWSEIVDAPTRTVLGAHLALMGRRS